MAVREARSCPKRTASADPRRFPAVPDPTLLEAAVAELETRMIKHSLDRNGWNISRVARELGLTRRGLYMKMARYGIEKAA